MLPIRTRPEELPLGLNPVPKPTSRLVRRLGRKLANRHDSKRTNRCDSRPAGSRASKPVSNHSSSRAGKYANSLHSAPRLRGTTEAVAKISAKAADTSA